MVCIMTSFTLHSRLAAGSHFLGRAADCQVLLKENASFPWLLIVPEVADGVEDLHQLEPARYAEVMELVRELSLFVSGYFKPDKLNLACIGNQVRQMHIHVVGRSEGDPAWPGTVWASTVKSPWEPGRVGEIREAARRILNLE
jgi:diadenosine tetraphosphate (Ap4A) HIT family hydrolase